MKKKIEKDKMADFAQQMYSLLKELQESASYWSEYDVPIGIVESNGMSKRFYAACFAMQGIAAIHSTRSDIDNEWICKTAFNMADELLKQENL